MITYTREQLRSFGNFLFQEYKVLECNSKGEPIRQREISHADIENWMVVDPGKDESLPLPSRYKIGDKAKFFCMPDDPTYTNFPGIPCEIIAIHFFPGKVKYDLDLLFVDNQRSRIYNVDSILVDSPDPNNGERLAYKD